MNRQHSMPFAALHDYFFSDSRRTIQTILGLVWLLDALLQFQSYMYSSTGFPQMLAGMEGGQPHWLSSTLSWGVRVANSDLTVWNTVFAVTQLAIAIAILYRPTVKLGLAVSCGWMFVVWWFGEAFGMLFANAANPLTGAPGAVLLYALIGLIIWPNDRPGGLLGLRGTRIAWLALWLVMAWTWLLAPNSSANATHDAILAAPTGMGWLTHLNQHVARVTEGNGLVIAVLLAAISATIGIAVGFGWQSRTFLWLAIYLNLAYWIFGQGLGGLATGQATDPNAGLLFVLFAAAVYTVLPCEKRVLAEEPHMALQTA